MSYRRKEGRTWKENKEKQLSEDMDRQRGLVDRYTKKKKSYHLMKEFSVTDPKGPSPLLKKTITGSCPKPVQLLMLKVYFSKNCFNITPPSMLGLQNWSLPLSLSQFCNCYLQKSYLGILTRWIIVRNQGHASVYILCEHKYFSKPSNISMPSYSVSAQSSS